MADIDTGLIGSVMKALPMSDMIATPLRAMIDAQISASKGYADFLTSICIKNGKAVQIQFDYQETVINEGTDATEILEKKMMVPLMCAIEHPNICIEEGTVAFELTVSQSVSSKTETSAKGGFSAKMGWGPFSVKVHGSVSHKSEQTRKTDTRAKYSISTKIKKYGPTEAMTRVMEALTDAATKPIIIPGKEGAQPIESLKETAMPHADEEDKGATP